MRFICIITRSLHLAKYKFQDNELDRFEFEADTIKTAKAKATRRLYKTTILKNVLRFVLEEGRMQYKEGDIIGKDLDWKRLWDTRQSYTQDDGKVIGWSGKRSANFSSNYNSETDTSDTYHVNITLYWHIEGDTHE